MLSGLIGDIYDAALDPTLWLRALERSCAFVGGSSAVLYWHDVASESSAALHLFNDDPHYTRLYFENGLSTVDLHRKIKRAPQLAQFSRNSGNSVRPPQA